MRVSDDYLASLQNNAEIQSDDEDELGEENLFDLCGCSAATKEIAYSPCCSMLCNGKKCFALVIFLLCAFFYTVLSDRSQILAPEKPSNFNQSRTDNIMNVLCEDYSNGLVSGNLCESICSNRQNLSVVDFHQGASKRVFKLKANGTEYVLKSTKDFFRDFTEKLDPRVEEDELTDKIVELVNEQTKLGFPVKYKRHLIKTLWPDYDIDRKGPQLSETDRASLWALLQQDEFITFSLLPLSRVTTQVTGVCGHFYAVSPVLPFRMKSYYMGLKAKILVHLMGTLKLFFEFLNEPLQWCDVDFSNLGLSASMPKRFVVLDADMLYTESKLNSILESKHCTVDDDCNFFDCKAKCNNSSGFCGQRSNDNIDVFCQKLIGKLFGNYWSKSNRYLSACHDTSGNSTKRLNDLRLVWSWSLSDL